MTEIEKLEIKIDREAKTTFFLGFFSFVFATLSIGTKYESKPIYGLLIVIGGILIFRNFYLQKKLSNEIILQNRIRREK